MYKEELGQQEQKISQLKQQGADEYDIKKQVGFSSFFTQCKNKASESAELAAHGFPPRSLVPSAAGKVNFCQDEMCSSSVKEQGGHVAIMKNELPRAKSLALS